MKTILKSTEEADAWIKERFKNKDLFTVKFNDDEFVCEVDN